MKKRLLVLCLTTWLMTDAHGAESTPPAIELKRKSSFDATEVRNPFWPIGWKKPGPKSANGDAGAAIAPAAFSLTSVTMGTGPHFAILNGKIMQEGQQFGLQLGTQIYQVTLRSIQDGRVIVAYQDSEIVVLLRRK
jgi:hypothetical protein